MNFKKIESRAVLAGGALLASGAALATDPYASVSAAVNWTNVGTDAAVVGVAVAGVFVIIRGLRMLIAFVKR